jgi:hypothetical protein
MTTGPFGHMCNVRVMGAVDEEQGICNDGIISSRSHVLWEQIGIHQLPKKKARQSFIPLQARTTCVWLVSMLTQNSFPRSHAAPGYKWLIILYSKYALLDELNLRHL